MTPLRFSSASSVASGPFQWRLTPHADDGLRFKLHRSLMASSSMLRLRGGPTAALWLRRVVGDYRHPVVAEATPDVRVSFDGFDRYWMRFFFRGDSYEPELYRLFTRMTRLRDLHFIDGGANIGLWTAILTGSAFGVKRAVAVEASPTTFAELARTAALCSDRFAAENVALSAKPGTVMFEQGLKHESRRIAAASANPGARNELVSVRATTIDDLVTKFDLSQRDLLVKLDVEGAEFDCFLGARDAFDAGAIFIYEDHGKDPTSELTRRLLAHGAVCWAIADDGQLISLSDAAHASSLKMNPKRGYNFVAMSRERATTQSLESRLFG